MLRDYRPSPGCGTLQEAEERNGTEEQQCRPSRANQCGAWQQRRHGAVLLWLVEGSVHPTLLCPADLPVPHLGLGHVSCTCLSEREREREEKQEVSHKKGGVSHREPFFTPRAQSCACAPLCQLLCPPVLSASSAVASSNCRGTRSCQVPFLPSIE